MVDTSIYIHSVSYTKTIAVVVNSYHLSCICSFTPIPVMDKYETVRDSEWLLRVYKRYSTC
jgi:hypothetical protein